MLVSTLRFIARGWIHEFYIAPHYHFTYYGLDWIKPLPGNGMYYVFGAMTVLAILITLGFAYRFSMAAFFLLFTYVELLDKSFYLNHYYLVSLLSFLLIFLPLHRAFSLDSWLRPTLKTSHVPRWTIAAIQLQLGIVYFFAGVSKLNPDWLLHAMPLKIWLSASTDFPLIGRYFDYEWVPYLMSWAGAFFDLTIPFFLVWRRSRPFAYLAVIGFHAMTGLLFPIGMFPWMMIGVTLIFFPASTYSRWLKFDTVKVVVERPFGRSLKRPPLLMTRLASGILVVFFMFQLLLPLRHWLYPGDVLWTEEGFRFSWRVMLVEKTGFATFYITEPHTGKQWTVYPRNYLTPQQENQMSYQPDMLLQFAHYLADDFEQHGYEDVEVRSEAYVSWNGRSSCLLIDPDVDLAHQPESILPKQWVNQETRDHPPNKQLLREESR